MRHFAAAFLALCFCLLAACAGMEGGRPAVPVQPETPPPETPPVEPEYQLDAATAENTFTAEDGTEVAHYTYTLLTLAVVNGEELPRELAERSPHAAQATWPLHRLPRQVLWRHRRCNTP